MKYYSYSASLSSVYPKPPRSRAAGIRRERVPKTINALDVLLSIWIAEAVLETDPPKPRTSKKSTPRS